MRFLSVSGCLVLSTAVHAGHRTGKTMRSRIQQTSVKKIAAARGAAMVTMDGTTKGEPCQIW